LNARLRALLPYLLVLAGAAVLAWKAMHLGYAPRGDRPGPDVWPRAILALLSVTCVVRIVSLLARPTDTVAAGVLDQVIGDALPDTEREVPVQRFPLLLLTGIALTVAYVALLGTLGFFCDTVVYVAALIRTGRYRRWPVIVTVALVGALAFMFVFMKIVYLSLPIGVAPFATVSLALMQLLGIR